MSHQPECNWLPSCGLGYTSCVGGVFQQGIPRRLRTNTGWWGGKQKDMTKWSRKEFISDCALPERQEKSLPPASRCQNYLGQKSSIHDMCHCRALCCGHCHCFPFLPCLQELGNISVYTCSPRHITALLAEQQGMEKSLRLLVGTGSR